MALQKRSKDKLTIQAKINELPRFLAGCIDIWGRRRKITLREKAIIKIILEHPDIQRIMNEERLEARRIVLQERRQMGSEGGGQL